MPNIILTSYCNLHCPYCFANTMINLEQQKNIDLNQYTNILNWIFQDQIKPINNIGLIGGEPTLHPNIKEILNITNQYCNKYNIKSTLFTNGIYINKIINDITKNIYLLININTPVAMTSNQWESLNNNLNLLVKNNLFYSNITLGCNICQEINDYSFFWDIVDKYNPEIVRVSIVAPTHQNELINKEQYYLSLKEKFLNFLYEAKSRHIKLGYDCNKIPLCYFNKEEIQEIKNMAAESYNLLCRPVIDIGPDFTATSCFGTYDPVNCSQFETFDQLYNYFVYKKNVPLTLANTQGKCATCIEHKLLKCQGGCLAFAKYNNKEE